MTIKEQFKKAYGFIRGINSGYSDIELAGAKFINAISANAWKAALISYSERSNIDKLKYPFHIRMFGVHYDESLRKTIKRRG